MGFDTYDSESHRIQKGMLDTLLKISSTLSEMHQTLNRIERNTMSEEQRKQEDAFRRAELDEERKTYYGNFR